MKLFAFLLVLILMPTGHGLEQEQPAPKKLAVLNNAKDYAEFVKTFEQFVVALSSAHEDVRGFVALSSKPGEIMPRYKFIRQRMREDTNLKRRLEVTRPATRYRGSWETTEFWLLPKNAESSYVQLTADYFCPELELLGNESIAEQTLTSFYSVDYPLENWLETSFIFKWTVTGGKIITGQGTTSITVERKRKDTKPIVVSIEITGGDDEDTTCLHNATIITDIRTNKKENDLRR